MSNGLCWVLSRALTEKIVAVLPRMKCPHRIEPHQIQGLDFIHIYPVVQVRNEASCPAMNLLCHLYQPVTFRVTVN